jgi:hypothetical protein
MYGNYRIYNKTKLDKYERDLHVDGPWFIEPKDYADAGPYSDGYRTFDEALTTADHWEEQGRAPY